MSATNSTSNYGLSQYIGSDEPKYLTDYNGDMLKIDTAIKTAETKADTAQTGVNTNTTNIATLDGAVGSLNTEVQSLASATTGNTGSINTINSLIGNGEPTTTDKTLIGAINELYGDIHGTGDPIEADDVVYDNTTSGLTATDVQSAIDELATASPSTPTASAVTYVNTTSGLTATNVQGAIDEVNGKFGGAEIRYDTTSQKMQYSADGGTTWANFSGALTVAELESAQYNFTSDPSTQVAQTYTCQNDHEELIAVAVAECFSVGTSADMSVAVTSSDCTVNEFQASQHTFPGAGGAYVSVHSVHIEDVHAGDVISFTPSLTVTGAGGTSYATMFYDLFTIN